MTRGVPKDKSKRKSGTEQMYGGLIRIASGCVGKKQICFVVVIDHLTFYPRHASELTETERKNAVAFEAQAIRILKKAKKELEASGNGARLNEKPELKVKYQGSKEKLNSDKIKGGEF